VGRTRTARTFPDRPIGIIAPFTPSSPNDVVARLIAPPMGVGNRW
jgi:tripartite-type tricarboxylate transporter receptor subunit TctC